MYYIVFTSVDGSGSYRERFTDRAEAIAFADAKQQKSNDGGNPWCYRYYVYRYDRIDDHPVYTAHMTYDHNA